MSEWYGINMPFIGGNEGFFSRQEGVRLIKNDLLQLLLTVPKDRIMRLDLGTSLGTYPFDQMDKFGMNTLRTDILAAIDKHEPRVAIDELIIRKDANISNQVNIKLYAHLTNDPDVQLTVETKVSLAA